MFKKANWVPHPSKRVDTNTHTMSVVDKHDGFYLVSCTTCDRWCVMRTVPGHTRMHTQDDYNTFTSVFTNYPCIPIPKEKHFVVKRKPNRFRGDDE